jgi:ribA/ribD-fused uncharacterized protein
MTIAFTKIHLPFGWLGNMSRHPLVFDGRTWPTAEHLFQALRFDDDSLREAIRSRRNPFAAKLLAKANAARMTITPCSPQDVANMRQVLRLKLKQHPDLRELLLATGDEEIVEDCTRRPHGNALFWGAALRDGAWVGENRLGRLWMRLREELAQEGLVATAAGEEAGLVL